MTGKCGRRSESLYMTPCILNPITCAKNLKSFVRLPKEKPTRSRAVFSVDADEPRNKMRAELGYSRLMH